MDSKTVNELLKSTESKDPDVLGRAYVRAVSIAVADLRESNEYEFPQIVKAVCKRATEVFRKNTVAYEQFIKYPTITKWIERNRYFAQCQQASFQRDTVLLKGYADNFIMAEQIIQVEPGEDIVSVVYPKSLDAYMNNIPIEPFADSPDPDEGGNANDRILYSYAWCVAYNTVIEMTATIHNVPELRAELLDINDDIQLFTDVMTKFHTLDMMVENSTIYSEAEKFSKHTGIQEFTKVADKYGCVIEPSADSLIGITQKIKDFSAFSDDFMILADMFPTIKEVLFDE